jgi:hypothetical protein
MTRKACFVAIFLSMFVCATSYGQSSVFQPNFLPNFTPPKSRHTAEPRKGTLEDLFPKTEIPDVTLQPLNLKGAKLPDLHSAAIEKLSNYYFVLVDNVRFHDFADVYKQNRQLGKPNFVTVDCIMHPWLAHRNAVKAACIEKYCIPLATSVIHKMIAGSVRDFRQTDDDSVKDDIQRNLAYLSVAARLLDPSVTLNRFGGVQELVEEELQNVKNERPARSAIFGREEDFGSYHPFGWYQSSDSLKHFFACRQWLGRMYLSLSDVTDNSKGGGGNEFRRAALLYRSLISAQANGSSALNDFEKLQKTLKVLEDEGAPLESGDLLPANFATTFPSGDRNLKVTLQALAEPLARTKLIISLKSSERTQLSSTSIFDLNVKDRKAERNLTFRLLTPLNPPEFDWMASQIVREKDAMSGFSARPVGLLFLHAAGMRLANNILNDNTWRLDEDLITSLPALDRSVTRALAGGASESIWQILANYQKPLPQNVPGQLRTSAWLTRCLQTNICSWLDDWLAIESQKSEPHSASKETASNENPAKTTPSAPAAPATGNDKASRITSVERRPRFNYLEPTQDVYAKLSAALVKLDNSLTELGMTNEDQHQRSQDFIRLTDRLSEISKREMNNVALTSTDAQLLANFDTVLEKISSEPSNDIYFGYRRAKVARAPVLVSMADGKHSSKISGEPLESGIDAKGIDAKCIDAKGTGDSRYAGVNLGLGGPAALYLIMRGPNGPVLCRGASYSYLEDPGDPVSQPHWRRKIEYGLLRPPFWCEAFEVVDDTSTKR